MLSFKASWERNNFVIIEEQKEIISVFPFLSLSFNLNSFFVLPQFLNIFPRFVFVHFLGKTYFRVCICFQFDLLLINTILIKRHS